MPISESFRGQSVFLLDARKRKDYQGELQLPDDILFLKVFVNSIGIHKWLRSLAQLYGMAI